MNFKPLSLCIPVLGTRIQIRIQEDPNVSKDPKPDLIKLFGFGSGSKRIGLGGQILYSKIC